MLRPETVFLFLLTENPHTHTKMASIPFWPPTYQSQAYIEHEACFSLLFHDVNGVRSNIMTTQEDYGAFIHRDWFKSKAHKRQDVCVCVSCERKLNAFSCSFLLLVLSRIMAVSSWLVALSRMQPPPFPALKPANQFTIQQYIELYEFRVKIKHIIQCNSWKIFRW